MSESTLLSDWVPYRNITADGVCRLAGNSLMAVIEYRGPNFPITPNYEMLGISNEVARRIGDHGRQDGWTINPIYHNFLSDGYLQPERHIHNPVDVPKINSDAGYIDAIREKRFRNKLYENRTFIAITYRPNAEYAEKLENFIKTNVKNEYDDWANYLRKFKSEVSSTASFLHNLMMIGGGWARICTADEVISLYNFEINGDKAQLRFPNGALSTNIKNHVDARIKWSEHLYLDGRPKTYIRVIGIRGLPEFHQPEMLSSLRALGFTFKLSQRFQLVDVRTLNSRMKRKLNLLEDSKYSFFKNLLGFVVPGGKKSLRSDAMAEERAKAADIDIRNEAFARCGGYLTTTAVVWGTNINELDDQSNALKREMISLGFKAEIEDDNEFPAYIGSFPGVTGKNKRSDLLTEKFCAYRINLSSPWTGVPKSKSEFDTPALMQCVTQGSMPFRLDFFSRANGGGHGVIFGQQGSGKSTLARVFGKQFLARHLPKYPNAGVIDFDVDAEKSSSVVACLTSGGNYISMKNGLTRLQPLRDIEDGEARAHAVFVIRSIVEVQGYQYTSRIGEAIDRALDLVATMPKDQRTMTSLMIQAEVEELRHALRDYCDGGIYGNFMDGNNDAFELSPWTLIELGDIATKDVRTRPIISSLLFRTQRALDGRSPKLFIIDEARIITMALGKEQLIRWLAECRKKLGIMFLCFHNIDDELTSAGITDALMTQCDTKIIFPRGDARDKEVRKWMDGFGVNDTLANDLATATGRQILFIHSEHNKVMIDPVLGEEELALCGVNGTENNERAIALYRKVGKDRFWIEHLKERGINNAEEILEEWLHGSNGGIDRFGVRKSGTSTNSTNLRGSASSYGLAAE